MTHDVQQLHHKVKKQRKLVILSGVDYKARGSSFNMKEGVINFTLKRKSNKDELRTK